MEKITQSERDDAAIYLAVTRNEVINAISGMNREQLEFKPNFHGWSIAETVHHLAIVDGLVMGMGANTTSAGTTKASAWSGRDDELLSRVRDRREKMKVPDIGMPSGELSPSAAISAFEEGRKALIKFVQETELPLRQYCVPHPFFGELDCYQWILSLGAHAERHLKQIQETIESPGFLRTSNTA